MSDQQQYANTANYSEHEESEVHVEIEHITSDDIDTGDTLNTNAVGQDELGQSLNGVVNVSGRVPAGKRTVILPYQRKILENFFMTGMNSASHPLRHLHEAAADQTGLELHVVKVTTGENDSWMTLGVWVNPLRLEPWYRLRLLFNRNFMYRRMPFLPPLSGLSGMCIYMYMYIYIYV